MNTIKKTVFILIISSLSALAGVVLYNYIYHSNNSFSTLQNMQQSFLTNYTPPTNIGVDFTYAAGISTPAVVHIKTKYMAQRNQQYVPDIFREFFGDQFFSNPMPNDRYHKPQPAIASGSGVIISENGYIITNNHVIDNGDEIEVTLMDQKNYTATVIGKDISTDLALLKIEADNLPYLFFANSDSAIVGQWVLAVGNPFNLTSTVTAGIVSAKARNINILKDQSAIESFIQTDAAVNKGNSGGALVNIKGELIGINTAIETPTGVFAGYSFAIPSNIAKKVMEDLLKYGTVQRGYLGVTIRSIDDQIAKSMKLDDTRGVFIDSVLPSSSAADAGIKHGDIIKQINNSDVTSAPQLQEMVARHRPGDKINIKMIRDGKEKNITLVLKNRDGNTSLVKKEEIKTYATLGVEFSELSDTEKRKMNIQEGIKISKIKDGSLRRNTNIREGFVITKINDKSITSIQDIDKSLLKSKDRISIEGMYPNAPGIYYYTFGM